MAMHDNATRMAREYIASPPLEKDVEEKVANLKKVKWARFDYITEWEWCARWMVTRCVPTSLIQGSQPTCTLI